MLLTFTDAQSNLPVSVNPKFVVVVFTAKEEDVEKTVINTTTGNLVVTQSYIDVVGQLQGAV